MKEWILARRLVKHVADKKRKEARPSETKRDQARSSEVISTEKQTRGGLMECLTRRETSGGPGSIHTTKLVNDYKQ